MVDALAQLQHKAPGRSWKLDVSSHFWRTAAWARKGFLAPAGVLGPSSSIVL